MGLQEYRKKRDFSKTSEPKGSSIAKNSGKNNFVIQKHKATNLHYDFRLQISNTLKSWAVPKNLSSKTGEKRLAVQTEDHPLEYLNFKGIIEEGYGKGTVEIEDIGEYETLKKEPISSSYKKGLIEVELKGKKFKGKYALIKARLGNNAKNWLIFKLKN